MSDQQVRMATFSTEVEAELAKSLLEEEGVRAVVQESLLGPTMPGTGPIFELLVLASEIEQAQDALDSYQTAARTNGTDSLAPETEDGQPAWICPNCDEVVSQELVLCPTCSTPTPPSGPPGSSASAPQEEKLEEKTSGYGDKRAAWALFLALFCMFLPGAGQIYAVYFLYTLEPYWDELSPAGRRNVYAAATINAIGFVGAVLLSLALFAYGHV